MKYADLTGEETVFARQGACPPALGLRILRQAGTSCGPTTTTSRVRPWTPHLLEYSHDHLVAEDRDASPMNHSNATYISDLRVCAPAAALSTGHLKYHWQTVPYEAERECRARS